jgi:low affinity Fe/Cu permease
MRPNWLETWFGMFAAGLSKWSGSLPVFAAAVISVLAWAAVGPFFHYSDAWMLIINTGTTIVTFLMVFIIQNSQNREGLAIQIKLDEIIRAVHGAKNSMINLEDLPQEELEKLRVKFASMAVKARSPAKKRKREEAAEAS